MFVFYVWILHNGLCCLINAKQEQEKTILQKEYKFDSTFLISEKHIYVQYYRDYYLIINIFNDQFNSPNKIEHKHSVERILH